MLINLNSRILWNRETLSRPKFSKTRFRNTYYRFISWLLEDRKKEARQNRGGSDRLKAQLERMIPSLSLQVLLRSDRELRGFEMFLEVSEKLLGIGAVDDAVIET